MCFAAYIGTNQKQTLPTWKQSETLLYLENLSKDDEVLKHYGLEIHRFNGD